MSLSYCLKVPSTIYSGADSLNRISEVLKKENAKRVAVFSDKGIEKTGLLEKPLALVREACEDVLLLTDLPAEPSYAQAQALVDECNSWGADFIIAIGGGSVMDTAKLSSILVRSDYSIKALLDNPTLARKAVKTLMIPTTAGTGAEATPNAIVLVPEKELKVGIVNSEMIADYVILDAVMIRNLPRKIASSTGLDALAHAIECYTSNKANPFSDLFALEALDLILNNIEKACDDRNALEEKNRMLLASFYAGIAITASGTTAVHALSYPLGGKYHIPHGVSNAMLLLPVMRFNEDAIRTRLACAYDRCIGGSAATDVEKSSALLQRLGEIVSHLDIPRTLEAYNVSRKDLEALVDAGLEVKRLLNNNMKVVTREDARMIYQQIL